MLSLPLSPCNHTYLLLITYPLSSSSFTFPLQFHIPLSALSVSLLPHIFNPIIFFGHSFPHFPGLLPALPSLSSLCFHSLHLLFSFTNAGTVSSHSPFRSPVPFLFLSLLLFLLLLFYNPPHPSRSLTRSLPPSHPPPSLALSWVCRQLLSGKVTLCVISAFHGSPLSLQRVIISFRVKGSICYKRTRASGIEGVRVGA